MVTAIATRPFAYLYHGGRSDWAAGTYTIGGTTYNAMTGRSLAPDYGEIRQLRYAWEHRNDPWLEKVWNSPEVKGVIGGALIVGGAVVGVATSWTGIGLAAGAGMIVAGSGLLVSGYAQESL